MSILRTHNLQNPDSSTINIVMDQGGNTNITGVTTVGSNFHVTSGQGYFSGRVGIGTVNPDRHLHLLREDNGGIGIKLQNNEGTASIIADSDALELYSDTTVLRSEAGTERVRLNSTGFGIGVSPQQKLDVVGSAHTVAVFRPDTNSVSAYGDASAVNNLINLRIPYGSNAGSTPNSGARWGIKFQGRNDGAEYGTDAGKSASIYGVSEDATAGYNRKVGLSFYTSPFDANQAERLRITSDGHLIVGSGYADFQSGTRGEASSTDPYKLVFQNQYSNGYTDEKLKLYLFNSGNTRQGFGPGPNFDLQYHCSGGTNQAKHNFYTDNVMRMEISDAYTGVTKPTQPGFYARRTTSGDGRAAGVITEWHISGTGSYNEGSHFKTTGSDAGRFVAPVTGKYYFAAQPGYKQTGQDFNFYFRINNVNVSEPVRIIDGGDDLTSHSAFTGTCIVHMTAGQKFDVYIGQTHHVNTTYCFFCGYLIG